MDHCLIEICVLIRPLYVGTHERVKEADSSPSCILSRSGNYSWTSAETSGKLSYPGTMGRRDREDVGAVQKRGCLPLYLPPFRHGDFSFAHTLISSPSPYISSVLSSGDIWGQRHNFWLGGTPGRREI